MRDAVGAPGVPGACWRALQLHGAVLVEHGGRAAWSVLALRGDEALDALFEYQVLLRREPGGRSCPARQLLGHALDLRIELDLPGARGARAPRWIHGVVSQAARLHESPRGTLYALRLRPALARARLRGQCRAWRGGSVPEVLRELVAPLGLVVRDRLRGPHAPQDYLVQFNQSDWQLFQRLTRQWGIHFWFEHRRGAHELVLADHDDAAQLQPAQPWRSIGVGCPGDRAEHEALQQLRLHRGLDQGLTLAGGWGPLRGLATGHRVELRDARLERAQCEFLVLRSRLFLREQHAEDWPWSTTGPPASRTHLDADACDPDGFGDAGRAWDFSPPRGQAVAGWELHTELWLRPAHGTPRACLRRVPPRVCGLQSALVAPAQPAAIGPGLGEVHTDALGRVRVRLAWDRSRQPVPARSGRATVGTGAPQPQGGRSVESAPGGGLPGPATTPWIRVLMPWAGCRLGRTQLPRVGQEVLLGYLDGELERPLVLGAMYHAQHRPPWALPRNRALGGLRSRELPGPAGDESGVSRGSQLVLDDTPGCLHTQLLCESSHAGLALGRMADVDGLDGEGGRGGLRGAGAELRTDADGLLHSGRALLLSTHRRCPDQGRADDARAALRVLRTGVARTKEAAAQAPDPQAPDPQAPDPGPPEAAFARAGPQLLLDGADGFALTASVHAQCAAGTRLDLAAAGRLGMHAGGDLLLLGAAGLRAHVHRMGLRLLAAAGALHLHACDGQLLAAARHRLCLRSAGDLRVRAPRGVLLAGGGSFVRLETGGIDYASPGPLLQRGAPPCLGLR